MKRTSRADAIASGLKRYFTGEPCGRGHVAERRVSDHTCLECARLKDASPAERERRREYFRLWQSEYRRNNSTRIKATEAKREKHKTKRMAETAAWKAANKEATSLHARAAKAKRRAAEGSYTRQDVERMMAEQAGCCAACPVDIREAFHVDHKIPLSRGGSNWPANLQLLCEPCNKSKGKKTMEEWLAWRAIYAPAGLSGATSGAGGAAGSSVAAILTIWVWFGPSRIAATSASSVTLWPLV